MGITPLDFIEEYERRLKERTAVLEAERAVRRQLAEAARFVEVWDANDAPPGCRIAFRHLRAALAASDARDQEAEK